MTDTTYSLFSPDAIARLRAKKEASATRVVLAEIDRFKKEQAQRKAVQITQIEIIG